MHEQFLFFNKEVKILTNAIFSLEKKGFVQ